ncbi:MAG: methionine biosynthesis protein MetW [Desulfuromonadales bacterium]
MPPEFTREYAEEQLRRSRNPFRRFIKGFYIRNILKDVTGPCIDFACGAGQLLARLPHGSAGVEINPFLIDELTGMGLDVKRYDPEADRYSLSEFPENHYSTCVMSHVLEHFANAAHIAKTLLKSCRRLGIGRIILVLPGWKGYQSDSTHKSFIDRHYLRDQGVLSCEGYQLTRLRYYPVNRESVGRYVKFHELIVVLDRAE